MNETDDSSNHYQALLKGPLSFDDEIVLRTLKQHYLDPPSRQPYNLASDTEYLAGAHKWGWQFVHNILRELFTSQHEGFFIEAGALDGEYLSSTLWLEQELGWNGLLIEPDQRNYRALMEKHRKVWSSNTCLSPEVHPQRMQFVSLSSSDSAMQMIMSGSSHLSSMLDANDDIGISVTSNVQCFPLASYLYSLRVTTVDFLSLDIQRAEKFILDTVPWNTIRVRAINVENTPSHNDQQIDYAFVLVMNSRNFSLLSVGGGGDYFFVQRDDAAWHHISISPMQKELDQGKRIFMRMDQ